KINFIHYGGLDYLISLFLLLQIEEVYLNSVSAIGDEGYIEPAVSASQKIINRLSLTPVHVAASKARGKNPFPKDWRMHAFFMDALPILNEPTSQHSKILTHEAYEDII